MKSTNQLRHNHPFIPGRNAWYKTGVCLSSSIWMLLDWGSETPTTGFLPLVVWRLILDINALDLPQLPTGIPDEGWTEPNKSPANREVVYQFNKDSSVKDLPLTYQVLWNCVGSIHHYTKQFGSNELLALSYVQRRTQQANLSRVLKDKHL